MPISHGRLARLATVSLAAGTLAFAIAARAASPIAVEYDVRLLSGNAYEEPDGSWTVQVGERIEWAVTWTVTNRSGSSVQRLVLADNFSAEIDVGQKSVNASQGNVTVAPVGGGNSATAVQWDVGGLPASSSAVLSFHVNTGINPAGKQSYTSPGEHCLDSGLNVKWRVGSFSLGCVPVHGREVPWMRIEISNTRTDWHIRKPGRYASQALQLTVSSNGAVSVYFRDFAGLSPLNPAGGHAATPIPVYYAAGETLQEASLAGWWSAEELNSRVVSFPKSPALEQGVSWRLWERLEVGEEVHSSEYEDQASIVFVLANAGTATFSTGTP